MALLANESYKQRQGMFAGEPSNAAELPSEPRRAICIMESQPNEVGKGVVLFEQTSSFSRTQITGTFTGLIPGNKHGFHIHQYGDLTQGCVTAGPHYNPHGVTHAGPEDVVRHVGDLGNVQADADGNGKYSNLDPMVQLFGPFSVIGRSCVLHKSTDDLGKGGNAESLKTGNAGARIACGPIGLRA